MPRSAAPHARHRPGFTLVELLVVLVIIALLIALLIPAVTAAIRAAKGAAVQAEINGLAQALADFKSQNGDYPPSRILLNESGFVNTGSTGVISGHATSIASYSDVTIGQLYLRTVTAFRKFFPRVALSPGSQIASFSQTGSWYDFNGDGVYQGYTGGADGAGGYLLQGPECLAFFLGGIPTVDANSGNVMGMAGFGKNPVNPFTNNLVASTNYSANRNPPRYSFDAGRFVANTSSAVFNGGNYFPGYLDQLGSSTAVPPQNFYVYFSTNNGSGYDPNDMNMLSPYETDALGSVVISLSFGSVQPVFAPPTASGSSAGLTISPSPNPYTTSPPAGGSNVTFQNAQSFQILSAGIDGIFGVGGVYNTATTGTGLVREDTGSPLPLSNSADGGLRYVERDNLTNFHNGKLE